MAEYTEQTITFYWMRKDKARYTSMTYARTHARTVVRVTFGRPVVAANIPDNWVLLAVRTRSQRPAKVFDAHGHLGRPPSFRPAALPRPKTDRM